MRTNRCRTGLLMLLAVLGNLDQARYYHTVTLLPGGRCSRRTASTRAT
jgi:hypothetical protein